MKFHTQLIKVKNLLPELPYQEQYFLPLVTEEKRSRRHKLGQKLPLISRGEKNSK
jgi:hypothetical protein